MSFDRWKKPDPLPPGDLTDPFRNDERNGKIMPFEAKNAPQNPAPDFARLMTPAEIGICQELGKRCSDLVTQLSLKHPPGTVIPPHPLHVAVDFSLVHLARGLDLIKCLELDDLILTAEYTTIAKHIDRRQHRFPSDVKLNLPLRRRFGIANMMARFKKH